MKLFLLVLAIVIALTGCGTSDSQEYANAATYCSKSGGKVETRYPFYDAYSQHPLRMGGSLNVCTFTAADKTSRIVVGLDTLYTSRPTLAASAYLQKQAAGAIPPASTYCSSLGGTDMFEKANAAGGWGNQDGSDVIALCVFPDLSVIDSQGLADYAYGNIRGVNLEPLLRYKLDQSKKPFE